MPTHREKACASVKADVVGGGGGRVCVCVGGGARENETCEK